MTDSPFDLAEVVGQESVPADLLTLPSMLSYDERALLHWAARTGSTGAGSVIDAGCFLGGSTLALGLGLRDRDALAPAPPGSKPRIHSFDLFRIGEERERGYFDDDYPFEVGASTMRLYERNIAPIRDDVVVHPGDINELAQWDLHVGLLFLDIAKSWATNDTVVTRFFPRLAPGAIVIQQDLVHFGHPWCAITMELLSDHFEFLGYIPYSSAVYRVRSTPREAELPTELLARLEPQEAVALINRSADRIAFPFDGYLRLAAAVSEVFYGNVPAARRIAGEIASRYPEELLPWITEHVRSVEDFALQADRSGHTESPGPN